MNPLNHAEPLAAKVHGRKPHDVTPITSLNEPYVPFLWLGRVCGMKAVTHGCYHGLLPCSKKVQEVHRLIEYVRPHAVLAVEPLSDMVHQGFIRFMEETR